jgi:hypothetical protein
MAHKLFPTKNPYRRRSQPNEAVPHRNRAAARMCLDSTSRWVYLTKARQELVTFQCCLRWPERPHSSLFLASTATLHTPLPHPRLPLAVPGASVPANSAAFEATAKKVGKNSLLRVTGHQLEGEATPVDLELTRVDIWAPDAVVLVDDVPRPAPNTVYFRGHVAGEPGSTVSLSVREKGGTMGMVTTSNGAWVVGKGKNDVGGMKSKKAQPDTTQKPFSCGQEELPHVHGPPDVKPPAFNRKLMQANVNSSYQVSIALETDYEYYAKFAARSSPIDAALDYAGDLMGYSDVVYSREVNTDILIGFIRLFTNGAGSDPYPTTTSSGTALDNLRATWLNTPSLVAVKRTIVHMLSGMSTGGGVAYVGVLCNPTYGFGYSGALQATFSWNEDQNR